MANGEWRMANGEWRMANEKTRTDIFLKTSKIPVRNFPACARPRTPDA
jgi:hypothetical protein